MYSSILSASPETPLQNEVNFLLTTGKLERIKGGMGGVLFSSRAMQTTIQDMLLNLEMKLYLRSIMEKNLLRLI